MPLTANNQLSNDHTDGIFGIFPNLKADMIGISSPQQHMPRHDILYQSLGMGQSMGSGQVVGIQQWWEPLPSQARHHQATSPRVDRREQRRSHGHPAAGTS